MASTQETVTESDETTEQEPQQAVPAPEVQAEPPVPVWASGDSLPKEQFHDVQLPVLGEWVRVRFLTNPEAAQLAFLPDLANFTAIMAKAFRKAQAANDETVEDVTEDDDRMYQIERIRYMVRVAHLSVMDRGTALSTQVCSDPGCGMGRHIPGMWSVVQCEMLDYTDLEFISSVAERSADLAALRPFSEAETQSSSPPPASSGA